MTWRNVGSAMYESTAAGRTWQIARSNARGRYSLASVRRGVVNFDLRVHGRNYATLAAAKAAAAKLAKAAKR